MKTWTTSRPFSKAVNGSQVYVRSWSGSPTVWYPWRRIANDNDINNVHSSINQAQTAAVTTSNSYTDKSTSDLKNSLTNFVTSDDLNGASSSWHGVTPNIKLAPGSSIKWRIQNNILYIVGGGTLGEDPKGDIFFTIPGIAGRVAGTVLYAWNAPDCSWNRLVSLGTDGNVTQWNCVNKMVFSINAAIPLD